MNCCSCSVAFLQRGVRKTPNTRATGRKQQLFSLLATQSGERKQNQRAVIHNRAEPRTRTREAHFWGQIRAFVLMLSLREVVTLRDFCCTPLYAHYRKRHSLLSSWSAVRNVNEESSTTLKVSPELFELSPNRPAAPKRQEELTFSQM